MLGCPSRSPADHGRDGRTGTYAKHEGLDLEVRAAVGTWEAVIAVDAARGDASPRATS